MKRIISLLICSALLFCGCQKENKPDSQTEQEDGITILQTGEQIIAQMFAMDTFIQVTIYDTDLSGEKIREAMQSVRTMESIFSATDPESELYSLNTSGGKTTAVSADLRKLLTFSTEISQETAGCFDVTAYPLIRAWGFTLDTYRIPSEEELGELLPSVDYRNIELSEEGVCLLNGAKVDLGALAKGYTGDILAEQLKNIGVTRAVISLGGNIVVIGQKNDLTGWKIGVRDPIVTSQNIGYLEAGDCHVITSGGYERYFEGEDGRIYWHIIDPKTGYPAENGLISVTVVGESGMICDALSTALFVMGEENAITYYQEHEGFEMILVTEEGALLISQGIADHFTVYEPDREVITVCKP